MEVLPPGVDSRFRYVLLVAKRAEQLIQGSSAKMKTKYAKPTRIAMEEIDQNQIGWRLAEAGPDDLMGEEESE